MAPLFYRRLLFSTLWLFVLPFALDVEVPIVTEEREDLWAIYSSQVGVREATGNNDGPEVEAYLASTGLGAGYAWCAAFVSWSFQQKGYTEPSTAWTPSLFPNRRVIWPEKDKLPQKSDVFGIYIYSKNRIAHAGFVEKWGSNFVQTIEGNTNPAGGYEGDGVYRRRRRTKSVHRVADWITNNEKNK